MDKIKTFFIYGSEQGLRLLAAFDSNTGKPSVTLLAVHVTLWMVIGGYLLSLRYPDLNTQVYTAIVMWSIANIFYLIRKITKFKLDADDKSVEIEDGSDEPAS